MGTCWCHRCSCQRCVRRPTNVRRDQIVTHVDINELTLFPRRSSRHTTRRRRGPRTIRPKRSKRRRLRTRKRSRQTRYHHRHPIYHHPFVRRTDRRSQRNTKASGTNGLLSVLRHLIRPQRRQNSRRNCRRQTRTHPASNVSRFFLSNLFPRVKAMSVRHGSHKSAIRRQDRQASSYNYRDDGHRPLRPCQGRITRRPQMNFIQFLWQDLRHGNNGTKGRSRGQSRRLSRANRGRPILHLPSQFNNRHTLSSVLITSPMVGIYRPGATRSRKSAQRILVAKVQLIRSRVRLVTHLTVRISRSLMRTTAFSRRIRNSVNHSRPTTGRRRSLSRVHRHRHLRSSMSQVSANGNHRPSCTMRRQSPRRLLSHRNSRMRSKDGVSGSRSDRPRSHRRHLSTLIRALFRRLKRNRSLLLRGSQSRRLHRRSRSRNNSPFMNHRHRPSNVTKTKRTSGLFNKSVKDSSEDTCHPPNGPTPNRRVVTNVPLIPLPTT